MKRITHAAENLITSNDIAEQLVDYAVRVSQLNTSRAVTIPVLESNGTVADHTLVINAASQFDVVDVDGLVDGEEIDRFGAPDFPSLGTRPIMQPSIEGPLTGDFDEFGDTH
jgi:hypothetical protein